MARGYRRARPAPAEPIRAAVHDEEAVLSRLLLADGITNDRYRQRLENLAAERPWFPPPA